MWTPSIKADRNLMLDSRTGLVEKVILSPPTMFTGPTCRSRYWTGLRPGANRGPTDRVDRSR